MSQYILGCGQPDDYIPVSQLVFPGYLNMTCSLGYNCTAKIWFFTDHFYYNAVYYAKQSDPNSVSDCVVSGSWVDLNIGKSNGTLQFKTSLDTCYNQSINSITTSQYDTKLGVVIGIP